MLLTICHSCAASGSCLCTSPTWPGTCCTRRVWSWCPGSILLAVVVSGRSVVRSPLLIGCLYIISSCLCGFFSLAFVFCFNLPLPYNLWDSAAYCKVDGGKFLFFLGSSELLLKGAPPVAFSDRLVGAVLLYRHPG